MFWFRRLFLFGGLYFRLRCVVFWNKFFLFRDVEVAFLLILTLLCLLVWLGILFLEGSFGFYLVSFLFLRIRFSFFVYLWFVRLFVRIFLSWTLPIVIRLIVILFRIVLVISGNITRLIVVLGILCPGIWWPLISFALIILEFF